jgi:hypothetical protein
MISVIRQPTPVSTSLVLFVGFGFAAITLVGLSAGHNASVWFLGVGFPLTTLFEVLGAWMYKRIEPGLSRRDKLLFVPLLLPCVLIGTLVVFLIATGIGHAIVTLLTHG